MILHSRGYEIFDLIYYCFHFYPVKWEAKSNRYLKSLEGMFWYRDPKNYIDVIDLSKSDSIIHIIPRKKKNLIQ